MSSLRESTDRKYELATDLTAPVPSPGQVKARELANGLRALADMIESHPGLPGMAHSVRELGIPVGTRAGARERIEAYVAAGRACGAEMSEWTDGTHAGVLIKFGPVGIRPFVTQTFLADEPPPVPAYRPLLGDTSGGAA